MSWHPHNLTEHSGAPPASSPPASHVFDAEGTQHVFHRAVLGTDHPREALVELWWRGGQAPRWGDLFAGLSGEVRTLSLPPLATHVVASEGAQHVFYEGSEGQVFELWWKADDGPHAGDLMLEGGQAMLGASGLASHVFEAEGTQHVFFTASELIDGEPVDGHIGELWWSGSGPARIEDLTRRSGTAPRSDSALASHVFTAEGTQHVFYLARPDIIELWWRSGEEP